MDDRRSPDPARDAAPPITEADLHAHVDRPLAPERRQQVEDYLAAHPDEQARVHDWQRQNVLLHRLLDPVRDEPLPLRLPVRGTAVAWPWRGIAASAVLAVLSAGAAWSVRGALDAEATRVAVASAARTAPTADGALPPFAQRAATAHVVYSPDARRPVEVGADQEQALVTWLTKRMGTEVRPPSLAPLGYDLIGGRLLPGERGPVAQFMYAKAGGPRLTLYVTREVPGQVDTAFRFGQDGAVNVFYWVENHFGYAISAGADKAELTRVSEAVYRQLKRD